MQRIDRHVPEEVKQKISNTLKAYHRQLSDNQKKEVAQKQSEGLRNYWATIPPKKDNKERTTVEDLVM